MKKVKWTKDVEDKDYSAALSYLSLLYTPFTAKRLVRKFKTAFVVDLLVKDVTRSAGLLLIDKDNLHTKQVLDKIKDSKSLSPVLLVRGNAPKSVHLLIADGYHRICGVYTHNEDSTIKAKIIDWT